MITNITLFIYDINNISCYYGLVFKNMLATGLRRTIYNYVIYLFGLNLALIR
jgi:hypothetical protein